MVLEFHISECVQIVQKAEWAETGRGAEYLSLEEKQWCHFRVLNPPPNKKKKRKR